ncbi:MAG: hypothetical protein A2X36_09425 [Elusimicrobia bacterium GWA2_69_24]|nr:MAG: hypothetical protein A2X36_09425 [Elusimicrobia bacterium GWA2_69_24]
MVHALFENAVLHAQNFSQRAEDELPLSKEVHYQLAAQIGEYAVAIMIFYFRSAGKTDLQQQVLQKHEDFIKANCGTTDPQAQQDFLQAWRDEIRRKVMWLSVGNNVGSLRHNTFAQNILSDSGFKTAGCRESQLDPLIEQFVNDLRESMVHFGVST